MIYLVEIGKVFLKLHVLHPPINLNIFIKQNFNISKNQKLDLFLETKNFTYPSS